MWDNGEFTGANDTVFMSIVQRAKKLESETPHNAVRNHMVFEPGPKAPECLPHDSKNKTHMASIGAMVFKRIEQC